MAAVAEFLLWLIVGAMVMISVWNVFLPGQLLGELGDWLWKHIPEKLYKPLAGCPICLPSIWGTVFYFAFVNMGWKLWPLYIVALSGLMKVVTILVLNHDEE